MLKDVSLPGALVYMSVDFGGEYGLVAQHLLHHPQVSPVFYQMRGKGVAEAVRGDFLGDSGHKGLMLDHFEDRHPAESPAPEVEEDQIVESGLRTLGPYCKVLPQSVGSHLPERDYPLFVAFSDDAHKALLEIQAAHPQLT